VTAKPTIAKVAPPAGEVDFADHALIDEFLRSFNDGADEFMSGDTLETHVAFENLQIGGADASEMNFDQSSLIDAKSAGAGGRSCDLRSSILDLRLLRCGMG
jgi:hypothetical protein